MALIPRRSPVLIVDGVVTSVAPRERDKLGANRKPIPHPAGGFVKEPNGRGLVIETARGPLAVVVRPGDDDIPFQEDERLVMFVEVGEGRLNDGGSWVNLAFLNFVSHDDLDQIARVIPAPAKA